MSLSERNAKIYGAVETKTFITFEGFCKKIYNTEQQEVEVFIDDKKVNTILANEKISNIEDTYEVFDTEGFCFTYKLPKEYIGEKHKLEFKTINGEQLIHSPFSTIDITNEKYNEYCFLESLNEPIDENKIKDMHCPNCIGFLAIEKNLEDKQFIQLIKELMHVFPNLLFKGFYFSSNQKKILHRKFKDYNLNSICLLNMHNIFDNLQIYLSHSGNFGIDDQIAKNLNFVSNNIIVLYSDFGRSHISVFDFEKKNSLYFNNFFNNLEYFGFNKKDINTYGNSFHELFFKKAADKYNVNIDFDLNESLSKAYLYWNLKLGLSNHEFFKYQLEFNKKFAKLQS